jgi:L-seryl-tRNA(Ser) seleniumtransferase
MSAAHDRQPLLASLPSVDELLKGPHGIVWLSQASRTLVVGAIREVLSAKRDEILKGLSSELSLQGLSAAINLRLAQLSSFSLRPVINATGIVLHTNLGRAPLSEKAIENVIAVSRGYSNLEYDLAEGQRGKRHVHTARILKQLTGAEDALIVNNNAAAVLLSVNTLSQGREVIVSRGELVEIGGSFRVPDVMAAGGAILREVGTTNKTHIQDYNRAISERTGLILKVHQSNYKVIGFTQDVSVEELAALGKKQGIPVMYDLGSGCLVDLKQYGIHSEPSVPAIMKSGVDLVTFSGDKLLGGPQGGLIVGSKEIIEKIRKNPLARAVRVDKMTIAAFEAVLMDYMDSGNVPVLQMLFQPLKTIKARAGKIAAQLRKYNDNADIRIIKDSSKAGGGSLPEVEFETYAVYINPMQISVNELEKRLRQGSPPVIARIRENTLALDARTIRDQEIKDLTRTVSASLTPS